MKFRKLKSPIHVQWELIPNCNYKCIHCYNYWRTCGSASEHIDYGIVTNQLIENNIFRVTLTGGEPLLVFSEIKPYIERMVKAGIRVSINTNASLLTQEMAMFFRENNIGLLISLPCSVAEINDKITTVKGSFDSTIAGIKLAKQNHVSVSINMVISRINKDYVIETAKFVHDELGMNSINVSRASRPINGSSEFDNYALDIEEFRKLSDDLLFVKKEYSMFVDSLSVYSECSFVNSETFNLFTKRKCFAGKTGLAIGYNGDIKACARDCKSYGNLKTNTLSECWDRMDDWRIIDAPNLPKECQNCDSKYTCMGGCKMDYNNGIPNKCYRDKSNLPIKYELEGVKQVDYFIDDTFEIVDELRFFEEDFGMKGINSKRNAFFVTKVLYKFMIKNKTFSKKYFMKYFEISSEDANDVLSYLIENQAIEIL